MSGRTLRVIKILIKLGLSFTSLQFIIVGTIGLLFSEALLYLMIDGLSLNKFISIIIATEAAVLLNFSLNDNWTFKNSRRSGGPLYMRIIKFHFSRIGSIVLSILLFTTFTEILGIHYLIANVLAVIIAFFVNFSTSFIWVWRAHVGIRADKGAKTT